MSRGRDAEIRTIQHDFGSPPSQDHSIQSGNYVRFTTSSDSANSRERRSGLSDKIEHVDEVWEKPKPVASTRKRQVFGNVVVYHLASILITIFITILYARKISWPDKITVFIGSFASIQFAAKVIELLAVLSVSNVLYHRLRFLFIKRDGIPLGFLYANFRLGNPLYFVSSEFLGAIRLALTANGALFTLILIILIAVVTFIAGPLSAILLTLTPGFWPFPLDSPLIESWRNNCQNWFPIQDQGYGLQNLHIAPFSLYLSSLGLDLGVTWLCSNSSTSTIECLSFFQWEHPQIVSSLMETPNTKVIPMETEWYNAITSTISGYNLAYNYWFWYNQAVSIVTCSTLPAAAGIYGVSEALVMAENYINYSSIPDGLQLAINSSWSDSSGHLPAKQPVVLSHRGFASTELGNGSVVDWNNTAVQAREVSFQPQFYPGFSIAIRQLGSGLLAQISNHNLTVAPFFSFLDIQNAIPYNISTASIKVTFVDSERLGLGEGYNDVEIEVSIFAAIWAEAGDSSSFYQPYNFETHVYGGGYILTIPGDLKRDPEGYLTNGSSILSGVVPIDGAWLNSLDIDPSAVNTSDSIRNPFAVDIAGASYIYDQQSLFQFIATSESLAVNFLSLPTMLAAVMAAAPCSFGACSQSWFAPAVAWAKDYNYSRQQSAEAAAAAGSQVSQHVTVSFLTHGYAVSTAVAIGLAVLWLHVLVAVAHILVVLLSGCWTTAAWSNLRRVSVPGPALARAPPAGQRGRRGRQPPRLAAHGPHPGAQGCGPPGDGPLRGGAPQACGRGRGRYLGNA